MSPPWTPSSAGGSLKISQPPPESMQGISSTSRKKARSASGSLLKIIAWAPVIMMRFPFPIGRWRAAGGGRSRAPCRGGRPSASRHSAPSSESPSASEHEPQGRLGDRPVLMAGAQMIDELVDRVEHRVRARRDCRTGSSRRRARRRPPCRTRRRRASTISIGSASCARARCTASSMPAQTRSLIDPRQRRLQPGGRAEMVEQIGVGLAHPRRRPPSASPPAAPARSAGARRLERAGAALFGAQALTLLTLV